jgi:hypothetical protein
MLMALTRLNGTSIVNVRNHDGNFIASGGNDFLINLTDVNQVLKT